MLRRWMPLVFLLLLLAGTVRLVTTLADPGADDGGFADFRDTIHAPASALLDGVDPYDVDAYRSHDADVGQAFPVYSPHHLLLTIPLAVLPRVAAGAVWWALNVALLLVVCGFVVRRVRPQWGVTAVFGLATLTLLSNPGRFNFSTGQATLPIVLGVYVAFTSSNRWLAGAGTALALIKPQYGIPVLVLLAACGRWRVAVDGIGIAALLSLPIVVALTFVEDGVGNLVRAISDNLDRSLSGEDALSSFRIDVAGTIMRQADVQFGAATTALIFVVLVGLGTWLVRRWGRMDAVAMSVVGLVTVLSLFHLPYDELILMWPIVGLSLAGSELGPWRWWAVAGMTAAAFNPLTVRFLRVGRGLDTITALLLVGALVAVTIGITRVRSELPAAAPA